MTKDNNAEQEQNLDQSELTALQNKVTRDFVEDHTGSLADKVQVDESTARLSDDQNRLITQRNMRK